MPKSRAHWENIANDFERRWQFPNCIGALDGKHIIMNSPKNTGSIYYNYKGTFSIVLLALSDAKNRFIYVDIGAYGKCSDGGIYSNCSLKKAIDRNLLDIPPDKPLDREPNLGPMPYVMVADEAFPLTPHIMRPYSGRDIERNKQVFNYRLSRARMIVEGTFGILVARWRALESRLQLPPVTAISIVKACCILHNIIIKCDGDSDPATNDTFGSSNIERPEAASSSASINIRDKFMEYFVSNQLPWQNHYIDRRMDT